MKAKLRLLFMGIAIVVVPCLLYLIKSSFVSIFSLCFGAFQLRKKTVIILEFNRDKRRIEVQRAFAQA